MRDHSPVDSSLLELFTEGDKEQEKAIAEIYIKAGEQALETLEEHVNGMKSEEEWEAASHKLRGSSSQMGANFLADLCVQAEKSHSSAREEKMRLLNAIEAAFEDVRRFFADRATEKL